jgi:hypothetical protein
MSKMIQSSALSFLVVLLISCLRSRDTALLREDGMPDVEGKMFEGLQYQYQSHGLVLVTT